MFKKMETLKPQELAHSMNDNLIFREVQIKDIPFLVSLMEQLGYPTDENTMKESIQKHFLLPNQKVWVAEKSGEVVGCIATAMTYCFHRACHFLRVITMVVDQKYRRSGIGKSLMDIVEAFALEKNCSHIELTSAAHRAELGSHAFYQSLGYINLNDTKKYFVKNL